MNKNKLEKIKIVIFAIVILIGTLIGINENSENKNTVNEIESQKISYEINDIPKYSGEIYVLINNNIPKFSSEDFNIEEDYYSNLENEKVRNGNDKNLLGQSK